MHAGFLHVYSSILSTILFSGRGNAFGQLCVYVCSDDDFERNDDRDRDIWHAGRPYTIRYSKFTCAQKLTRWPA